MQSLNFYNGNIIPENDTIFVFGSNPDGIHGAGSAKVALNHFGAQYGIGKGLVGNSYALPTKDIRVMKNNGYKSISEEDIIQNIRELYTCAKNNPNKKFKVAYRNKGNEVTLNGYNGYEMSQMFIKAGEIPENMYFSQEWKELMCDEVK